MKKVDIRKIYVGKIAKQSEISSEVKNLRFLGQNYKVLTNHTWEYDNDVRYGLFIKVPLYIGFTTAYKHILTGKPYYIADQCSGGHEVIIPKSLEKLTDKEEELCGYLIRKRLSFNLDLDTIQSIEDRINTEYLEEKQQKSDNDLTV